MSKVESFSIVSSSAPVWSERNQKEVEQHTAWYSNITPQEAETLLKGHPFYTYVLRQGDGDDQYCISYVRHDGKGIKHQPFNVIIDKKGWHYLNGAAENIDGNTVPLSSDDLSKLIVMMTHCNNDSLCNPLKK